MLNAQVNSTGAGWTPEDVKRLIKSVRHSSYLYDPGNPKHFDPKAINQGWEIVSQLVGKTALECRGKWSHIALQLKKIEQNRKVSNSTPNWVYYNLIGFMLPFIQSTEPPPTKRDRSPVIDVMEIESAPREKMVKITPNNASTSLASIKSDPPLNIASTEYDFPADEPTQFLSSSAHNIEHNIPNSPNSLPDQNQPDLPDDVVSSNAHFLKMIYKEMIKLSNKDQSEYRIIMLTKLHEMLFKNE